MNQTPLTETGISRSSTRLHQPDGRLCRFLCIAMLAVAVISAPCAQNREHTTFVDSESPICRFDGSVGFGLESCRLSTGRPLPNFLISSTVPAALSERFLSAGSAHGQTSGRIVSALALVLGLFLLAALSSLALTLLRQRAWKQLRAESGDDVLRDLALLDATIHAEMKRYESLSRLERGA